MKRIQSACIMQTLRFQQKDGTGLPREALLRMNRDEVTRYKTQLEKSRTRHRIDSEAEQPDGAIILRVRKEYNASAPVGDYFD
ncbi:hypothetical protein [Ruminococcus flavefaciens]|uniref:hypothetical protein n=1 Tax=Ruminococcus flavefaciens TaxID=1265 RepID=UPI00048F9F55|nr:hypothetical protein [Ruminococcus flavefaciens]